MWSDEERPPIREHPRKLTGKAREAEVMRILAELKVDYAKLNKLWGICQHETRQ